MTLQVKTLAVKVMKEAISQAPPALTMASLRGYDGPMAPSSSLEPLVYRRAVPLKGGADPNRRYLVLAAKHKPPKDDSAPTSPRNTPASPAPSSPRSPRKPRSTPASPKLSAWGATEGGFARPPSSGGGGRKPLLVQVPVGGFSSPNGSAPTTPVGGDLDLWEGAENLTAHFPVNLFITAIADGVIAKDTPPKAADRLSQIVKKVPKEQNTSVDVMDGKTIDLKMRVFVVNSEDAKAVGEYISTHIDQVHEEYVHIMVAYCNV